MSSFHNVELCSVLPAHVQDSEGCGRGEVPVEDDQLGGVGPERVHPGGGVDLPEPRPGAAVPDCEGVGPGGGHHHPRPRPGPAHRAVAVAPQRHLHGGRAGGQNTGRISQLTCSDCVAAFHNCSAGARGDQV